jgi:CMP-N,N'-diacetyllegionaminic acid synthase
VLLQPTSPLVEPEDVLGALRLHRQHGCSVVSVTPSEHPLEWFYRMDSALRLGRAVDSNPPSRRQDAVPVYRLNGAVYASTPSLLRDKRSFLTECTLGYVMPNERSLDVDTPWDLHMAEFMLKDRDEREHD